MGAKERGLLHFALRGSRQEKRIMDTAGVVITPVAYCKINILTKKKNILKIKPNRVG